MDNAEQRAKLIAGKAEMSRDRRLFLAEKWGDVANELEGSLELPTACSDRIKKLRRIARLRNNINEILLIKDIVEPRGDRPPKSFTKHWEQA